MGREEALQQMLPLIISIGLISGGRCGGVQRFQAEQPDQTSKNMAQRLFDPMERVQPIESRGDSA